MEAPALQDISLKIEEAELNEAIGKTFVIITHDLEVARHMRRIIHLRDGLIERDEHL